MNWSETRLPTVQEASPAVVAMPPALRALSSELESPRTARSMRRLAERIAAGEPWDAALSAADVGLPLHLRALLQASLRTERLPEALAQLVDLDRRRGQLKREIWTALAYPAMLLIALLMLFFLYEGYFIREVMSLHTDVLTDVGMVSSAAELPSLTEAALYLSRPMPLAAIALAMTLLALLGLVRQVLHPPGIDALFNRLPVIGSLWHWSALADCARMLALLLRAEIPLPQALGMAATATRNGEVAAGCWDISRQVQGGHAMADVVERSTAFPRTLAPLVRWGESHSALPEALAAAAEMFEGRVRVQLGFIRTFLPPVLMLLVAGAILCSILAAFLPMFQVLRYLS